MLSFMSVCVYYKHFLCENREKRFIKVRGCPMMSLPYKPSLFFSISSSFSPIDNYRSYFFKGLDDTISPMALNIDLSSFFPEIPEIPSFDVLANCLLWLDKSSIPSLLEELLSSYSLQKWVYSPLLLFKLLILQDQKKPVTAN